MALPRKDLGRALQYRDFKLPSDGDSLGIRDCPGPFTTRLLAAVTRFRGLQCTAQGSMFAHLRCRFRTWNPRRALFNLCNRTRRLSASLQTPCRSVKRYQARRQRNAQKTSGRVTGGQSLRHAAGIQRREDRLLHLTRGRDQSLAKPRIPPSRYARARSETFSTIPVG